MPPLEINEKSKHLQPFSNRCKARKDEMAERDELQVSAHRISSEPWRKNYPWDNSNYLRDNLFFPRDNFSQVKLGTNGLRERDEGVAVSIQKYRFTADGYSEWAQQWERFATTYMDATAMSIHPRYAFS